MSLQSELGFEKRIMSMLQDNNPLAWENLYDKYATAMYGLIYNLTENKVLAEEIFKNVFLELKQKQVLLKAECSLYPTIIRYTYSYTTNHLKEIGINPKTLDSPKETQLIYLLTTKCNSLSEVASILNISVIDAKKRLQDEFVKLRVLKNISSNNQDRSRI